MNRETLYDLRALLALYPYYQTARLLMLQNLYLLHDPSFDEELRRAAIYISDRKVIFQMVEAAHYQLKSQNSNRHEAVEGKPKSDRTSSLIDHFLHSIPTEAEEREKEPEEKRKPTPADAAVDYVAYLMETETETEHEQPSRTIALIDDFIEEGGFKLHKDKEEEDQESEVMEKKEERKRRKRRKRRRKLQKQILPKPKLPQKTVVSLRRPLPESTSSRASTSEPIRLSTACTSSIHRRVRSI